MTIPYRVVIGGPLTSGEKRSAASLIDGTFDEVDRLYNNWNPDSELSRLNRASSGEWLPLSPPLEKLLLLTDRLVKQSGGRFDPTIEPLRKLWRESLEQKTVPKKEERTALAEAVGWDKLQFKQGFLKKMSGALQIDLGGIAKGYAVDLLLERLLAAGHRSLYVEWGGEIRTAGAHPSGRPWRIFISRLQSRNPDEALAVFELHDEAAATSGDYLQNWEVDGVRYSHLFDPTSLTPCRVKRGAICSVTVKAPLCAVADALATAVMLFPSVEEAEEWAKKIQETYPEAVFWIVTRN